MKFEDYEKQIDAAVKEPDKATAIFKDLKEKLKADLTTAETLKQKAEKDATRIKDLEKTNMQLYFGQTGRSPEEKDEPEELHGKEYVDDFFQKLEGDKK